MPVVRRTVKLEVRDKEIIKKLQSYLGVSRSAVIRLAILRFITHAVSGGCKDGGSV
jgi:Zn-dependent peptidase ImmA (M78 family)